MRGGAVMAFLFRTWETEGRPTSTFGSHELECDKSHWLTDWGSDRKTALEQGLKDCLPSRYDPGVTRLFLLKSPITTSATRITYRIRSSLKLTNSDNSGYKADHRKEFPSPEDLVYSAQGPMGLLAGQLAGQGTSSDRSDSVGTSESMFHELGSSDKACKPFEEASQVKTVSSSSSNSSLHSHRIHATATQSSPDSVWRDIDLLPDQCLSDGENAFLETSEGRALLESRCGPPNVSGEIRVSNMCGDSSLGGHLNPQNGCQDASSLSAIECEHGPQFPVSVIGKSTALLGDSSQRDEAHSQEEDLAREAKNSSNELHVNSDALVSELERGEGEMCRAESEGEEFDDEDNGDVTQESKASVSPSGNEADGCFCIPDMNTLTASNEDDIWSDEALISSEAKGFPPPISILANESYPGVPSHMPRTFWRSVKRYGRFVLQRVQARPREFFRATRQNGRLRLQLIRPDSDEDLQLGEGRIEGRQLDKDVLPRMAGKDETLEETILRYGPNQVASNMNIEKLDTNENSGISKTVEEGHTSESNECENCRNMRDDSGTVYSSGSQSRQDFQHAHCVSTFGFDNALNLLSPSKAFFQVPLTHIQPAVR